VPNLPAVSTTPAATSFASVVDTGGIFATGVNAIGGKWEQYQAADILKGT
jgi:hypothetical protein